MNRCIYGFIEGDGQREAGKEGDVLLCIPKLGKIYIEDFTNNRIERKKKRATFSTGFYLELLEPLLSTRGRGDLEYVVTNCLGKRSALANCHNITWPYIPEAGRDVDRHVLMPLLKSVVLLDVVQVITTNRDCPIHFHLLDNTSQDAATDGDIAGEWALLVNISAINSLSWSLEAKPDFDVFTLGFALLNLVGLGGIEDFELLLESLFTLEQPCKTTIKRLNTKARTHTKSNLGRGY